MVFYSLNIFILSLWHTVTKAVYGLKNVPDIVAYEFGYADRIIAKDIGQIIDAEALKKTDDNIGLMKKHRKEIKNRLTSYPNYFRDVIQI